MKTLAWLAIGLGGLMIAYAMALMVDLWLLTLRSSQFHDTYYVLPPLYGLVIYTVVAGGLIFWGLWRLKSMKGG